MTLSDGIAQSKPADTSDRAVPMAALNHEFDGTNWVPRLAAGTPGTPTNLTTLAMTTLTMDGTSKALPSAPAGASALQIQPQSGDVRVTLDSSAASSTNGLIYYEGGLYDHPYVDRAATRVYGVAGVSVVLIWKGS